MAGVQTQMGFGMAGQGLVEVADAPKSRELAHAFVEKGQGAEVANPFEFRLGVAFGLPFRRGDLFAAACC